MSKRRRLGLTEWRGGLYLGLPRAHPGRARRALRGSTPDGTLVFVLAAVALAPLAFLIGEATENVAEHTGPGIGGFLNASFGNAPELIIALFAIGDGLPDVVRGSITGSVVSTCLLVLGGADRARPRRASRRSPLAHAPDRR